MDDDAFVELSELWVLVPEATELSTGDLFTDAQNHSSSYLTSIRQRTLLYFDELLSIYVALRTHNRKPSALEHFTSRLSIILELRASGSEQQSAEAERQHGPNKKEDVIWRGTLIAAEEPTIIAPPVNGASSNDHAMVAIWECKALLSRPRVRLQSPVIVFNASAVLGQQKDLNHNGRVDPYLPSGQPAPENILAPLTVNDPTDGPIPSLSSLRLHRIRPFIEDTRFEPSALSVHVPNPFPALPAIASHIRHHKCERSSARPELIAALNLEIAPFSEDNVVIVKVEMHLADGKAVDLGQGQAPKLPLECRPQDNVVFLYRLTLDQPLLASGNSNTTKTLDVSIDAIGLSSKKCRPRIKMQWTTSVDFSEALNPTYGTPQQSMQRANRPLSLNFPAASVPVGITNRVRPVTQDAATSSQTGVSITFSAPAEVHIHEDFIIEILVVNNSSQAKRLTVSAISQESKKALGEGHKVLPTSQSGLQHQDGDVAEAFIREDALFASLQTAKGHTPEVLALSAAVELSLLEPGSCYSTQMTYVALAVGHLQVGPVRVTDAASNTSIDVHDMPTVVAVQRPGGSVEQERHSNS